MSGGGAERQLAYLSRALGPLGWTVHVALIRRGTNWPRLQSSGAVIHEIPARTPYSLGVLRRLYRLTREIKPDLVQVWLLQMEVLGGLAALSTGTPWIFSERSSAGAYPPTMKNYARRRMARLADAIVSNSAAGDDYWRRHVGNRVTRYVIPNGVPLAEIEATRATAGGDAGIERDVPLVLFAGRVEWNKNVEVLVRAMQLVRARQDVMCICCGEGPQRAELGAMIESEGLAATVRMIDYVPDLWSLMKRATVFASPSLFEGSPNVVLEAMACRLPLVISDIPAHRELVDAGSAVLVDARSPEQMASGILRVINEPAEAAARAEAARQRVARFDIGRIADRYVQVYGDVLAQRSS
jgi:glycosyltransferase involved in cell wall biosynthesis